MDNEPYILLFDGVCNLCNGVVQFVIKRDQKNKFKFAPLQSAGGQASLKKFGLRADDFDSFVLIHGDNYFLRSSAVLHVLKESGGIWKVFYAFIIFPEAIRDFVYKIVARTRYNIFGRRDSCIVPGQDIQQRFLD